MSTTTNTMSEKTNYGISNSVLLAAIAAIELREGRPFFECYDDDEDEDEDDEEEEETDEQMKARGAMDGDKTCSACGEHHPVESLIEVEGGLFCDKCFECDGYDYHTAPDYQGSDEDE
jgi:hypothetical protein